MPDVVGGEAVPSGSGGTDAMTQTPSSADAPAAPTAANVSGGDGIVTEEQVQKGYVWMNEVNNNIFDATYDGSLRTTTPISSTSISRKRVRAFMW